MLEPKRSRRSDDIHQDPSPTLARGSLISRGPLALWFDHGPVEDFSLLVHGGDADARPVQLQDHEMRSSGKVLAVRQCSGEAIEHAGAASGDKVGDPIELYALVVVIMPGEKQGDL